MAEIITEFPTITRTRKSLYPWAEWMDGQIRQVREKEDFDSSLKTFVQGLYAHAKRHDIKVEVRTAVEEGIVCFRFLVDAAVSVPVDTQDEAA